MEIVSPTSGDVYAQREAGDCSEEASQAYHPVFVQSMSRGLCLMFVVFAAIRGSFGYVCAKLKSKPKPRRLKSTPLFSLYPLADSTG
jgi:hypothetical protein